MDSKVLIVEDEPKLREVLCDYFKSKAVPLTTIEKKTTCIVF